jgi:hypothetical protein
LHSYGFSLIELWKFRRLISGSFAFTFLTSPDVVRAFSATLTTLAFAQRSCRLPIYLCHCFLRIRMNLAVKARMQPVVLGPGTGVLKR